MKTPRKGGMNNNNLLSESMKPMAQMVIASLPRLCRAQRQGLKPRTY